jgi:hypothetical protein
VVGATFSLSPYEGNGAALIISTLSTTSPTNAGKIQINPPMILAGKWANYAHCNTNIATESTRKSWTLYLDKRAFVHGMPIMCHLGQNDMRWCYCDGPKLCID